MATKKKPKSPKSREDHINMRMLLEEVDAIGLHDRYEDGSLVAGNIIDDMKAIRKALKILLAKVKP